MFSPPSVEPSPSVEADVEIDTSAKAGAIVSRCLDILDARLETVDPDSLDFDDMLQIAQTARAVSAVRGKANEKTREDETYDQLLARARKIPGLAEALTKGGDDE